MTNYRRGYTVERKAIDLFKKRGFNPKFCARTAGSHSQADVLAVDTESRVIVIAQCKRSKTGHFPKVQLPPDGTYLVEFRVLNWQDGKGFVLETDGDGNAVEDSP